MDRYAEYIKSYLELITSPFGKCREASLAMQKAFPELQVVRGHVMDSLWGIRGHWWLTTLEGTIVDPTAEQFPSLVSYHPWKSGDPVRGGTCAYCGASIYHRIKDLDTPRSFILEEGEYFSESFCSQQCEAKEMAHLNSRRDHAWTSI